MMTEPTPPIQVDQVETDEQAQELAAWTVDQLRQPIIVILDAEVRELAAAFAELMQLPRNAGEAKANNFLAALNHLSQAREYLRRIQ